MEHHRLKPMKEGYNEELFNQLYKKTTPLRKKLAYEIDHRKFGVDYKEILSWFDVKFIFAYNTYFDKQPERLLGYIISSLKMYKWRIMRSSYVDKYNNKNNTIDITDLTKYDNIISSDSESASRELFMNLAMSFIKDRLSNDALLILELELNPPEFIISQLDDYGKDRNAKIPDEIFIDYLSLENNKGVIKYIKSLRKDIKDTIIEAREYFKTHPSLLPALN